MLGARKLIFLTLLGLWVGIPLLAHAAIPLEVGLGSTGEVESLPNYIAVFFIFVVGATVIASAISIMLGGLQWGAALGNTEMVSSAKDRIVGGIIGMVLALSSYAILAALNVNLVLLPDIEVPGLSFVASADYFIAGCSLDTEALPTSWSQGVALGSGSSYNNVTGKNEVFGGGTLTADEVRSTINSTKNVVSPMFIVGIAATESGWKSNARSDIYWDLDNDGNTETLMGHACGVAQFIPPTATDYLSRCSSYGSPSGINLSNAAASFLDTSATVGSKDEKWNSDHHALCQWLMDNPAASICMKDAYLLALWEKYDGDEVKMAAEYNGGPYATQTNDQCGEDMNFTCIDSYEETRNYIGRVDGYKQSSCSAFGGTVLAEAYDQEYLKDLYNTPTESSSDSDSSNYGSGAYKE